MKKEHVQNQYNFWSNQIRLVNFFSLKSGFVESKRIKKPEDVYSLQTDEVRKELTQKKLAELSDRKLTAEEYKMLFG